MSVITGYHVIPYSTWSRKLDEGIEIGTARFDVVMATDAQSSAGLPPSKKAHIMGACGEAAFSLWLPGTWSKTVNDWSSPDVDEYEVRSTRGSSLVVRDADNSAYKLDRPYALLTYYDDDKCFVVRGWQWGCRVYGQRRYLACPQGGWPAFFCPARDLEPFHAKVGHTRRWLRSSEIGVPSGPLVEHFSEKHWTAEYMAKQKSGESLVP